MNHVPITLFYGSVTALLLCGLGANVSRARGNKFGVTAAPDAALLRIIRAHGNATEWAPMMILMLLLLELGGAGVSILHIFGGCIVGARVLHGAGVLMRKPFSVVGATMTYLLMLAMPVYGIILHCRG